MNIQLQIGGGGNQQVIKETIANSLGKLLNDAEERLQERSFASDEVKQKYSNLLSEQNLWIFQNKQNTFDATTYIVFPFKTLPEDEIFADQYFLESVLDALSIIAFSDFQCQIEHNHLNFRINGSQVFGVYYQRGMYDLIDSFQRLIKSLKSKNVILPSGFIFIILNCMGQSHLDSQKIKNIVTDILGDDPYIRPLQTGMPKCVNITSYIIQDCQSVDAARTYIREVLSLA